MSSTSSSSGLLQDTFPLDVHYAQITDWLDDRCQMLERNNSHLFRKVKIDLAPKLVDLAKVEVPQLKKSLLRLRTAVKDANRRIEESKLKFDEAFRKERSLLQRCGLCHQEEEEEEEQGKRDVIPVMDLIESIHSEAEKCSRAMSRACFQSSSSFSSSCSSSCISLAKCLELFDNLVNETTTKSTEKKQIRWSQKLFPRLILLANISEKGFELLNSSSSSSSSKNNNNNTEILLKEANFEMIPHQEQDRLALLEEISAFEIFLLERQVQQQEEEQKQESTQKQVNNSKKTSKSSKKKRFSEEQEEEEEEEWSQERRAKQLLKNLRTSLSNQHQVEMIRMSRHSQAMESFLQQIEQTRILQDKSRNAISDWEKRLEANQKDLEVTEPKFEEKRNEMKELQTSIEDDLSILGKRKVLLNGDINNL